MFLLAVWAAVERAVAQLTLHSLTLLQHARPTCKLCSSVSMMIALGAVTCIEEWSYAKMQHRRREFHQMRRSFFASCTAEVGSYAGA